MQVTTIGGSGAPESAESKYLELGALRSTPLEQVNT
jgi:hypothetical protein